MRSRVCAAMVAAVRVSRPQKLWAPWRASSRMPKLSHLRTLLYACCWRPLARRRYHATTWTCTRSHQPARSRLRRFSHFKRQPDLLGGGPPGLVRLRRFVGSRNRPLAALAPGGQRSFPGRGRSRVPASRAQSFPDVVPASPALCWLCPLGKHLARPGRPVMLAPSFTAPLGLTAGRPCAARMATSPSQEGLSDDDLRSDPGAAGCP